VNGHRAWIDAWLPHTGQFVVAVGLTLANLAFNIIAGAAFRFAADSATWERFLFWQVIGNGAGFITVITLTALLRLVPLSIAYPVTTGLAVIGVQVLAAAWLFHEPITARGWVGTVLIVAGILIIGQKGR
jgi:undecaprenyl phosphate-alpha-L-ara4N flippase subunit ArnE